MKQIIFKTLAVSFSVFLLNACGSGGSSAPVKEDNPDVSIEGDELPTVTIEGDASLIVTEGDKMTFTAVAEDDNEVASIIWSNEQAGTDAQYDFTSVGKSVVSVKVTDDAGQTAQAEVNVTVKAKLISGDELPTVTIDGAASSLTVIKGDKLTFTAVAKDDNQVESITWDNGQIGQTAEYEFKSVGDITVSVEVKDDSGQTAQAEVNVTVKAKPIAGDELPTVTIDGAASLTVIKGDKLTFTAVAKDDNQVESITWDNGQIGQTAEYEFKSVGDITVSVKVKDDTGQTAQAEVTVTVKNIEDELPTVTIAGDASLTVTEGDKITFTAVADDDKDIITWNDGQIGKTAEYEFKSVGDFTVSVVVKDDAGQTAVAKVTVSVVAIVEGVTLYIDPQLFDSAPTIWAWIEGGTQIHEDDLAYEWDAQETLSLDSDTGYYAWTLPEEFEAELTKIEQVYGKPLGNPYLSFKLNKGDRINRSTTGCYTNGRWFDLISECKAQSFTPYIGPYLTLTTPTVTGSFNTASVLDPSANMIINYELENTPSDFVASAEYRKAGSTQWIVKQEDPQVHIPWTAKDKKHYPHLDENGWGVVHHISLNGLAEDTKYEYRIAGPGKDNYSVQYHFTTAKKDADFSHFLVIGDMQDEASGNDQRWQDVADAIKKDHMDEFDFIITVGDMVKNEEAPEKYNVGNKDGSVLDQHYGERFYWWKVFFNKGREVFAYKAMLPAMGNHDSAPNPELGISGNSNNAEDTRSFRKYFYINPDMNYPEYYSYSYGNACFMSVNSEIPVYYAHNSERENSNNINNMNHAQAQSEWLSAEVDKATNCDWSLGYWHVPPINPIGTKGADVPHLRKYVDKFNNKLDWSLTGHVHQYQRLKPVTATNDSITEHMHYGRAHEHGVGYLTATPAGQNPRNIIESDNEMHRLAYYPGIELGESDRKFAYEVGFTIINIDKLHFKLETYGLGATDKKQPTGYKHLDGRKLLIDTIEYDKTRVEPVKISAAAGSDVTIKVGETVSFDGSDSFAASGNIESYSWDNNLTGVTASKVYNKVGLYAVTLTVTDDKGNTASDELIVTVQGDFTQEFKSVDFRGTPNSWEKTPMLLVAANTWQIEVTVASDDLEPRFKFYRAEKQTSTDANKWYGDDGASGETHTAQDAIIFTKGAGDYRITLIDKDREYTIEKL